MASDQLIFDSLAKDDNSVTYTCRVGNAFTLNRGQPLTGNATLDVECKYDFTHFRLLFVYMIMINEHYTSEYCRDEYKKEDYVMAHNSLLRVVT